MTEIEKLKYWLDGEITLLHIMFYVLVWLLTHSLVLHIVLALLIAYSVFYFVARISYLAQNDKDYLKLPRE